MSLVLTGSTSGSCTLQEQAVAGTTTLTLPTFSGTVGLLVSGTAVTTTSGTSIDFTSIPAGVRRITVMFNGVSTSGSSYFRIQIGSGSIDTSGYASTNGTVGSTGVSGGSGGSAGWEIISAAASTSSGSATLQQVSGNIWVFNSLTSSITTVNTNITAGNKTALSGALDRVRITTVNGTDTFDAGSINILYE
jgi:hypothetical protein